MSHALAPARVFASGFTVHTRGRGFTDVSGQVHEALSPSGIHAGIAHVFVHHTSCSLLLGENADPEVRADLERFFARLIPDGDPLFQHDAEGADDMPAHIRSILTGASVSIPVHAGKLALGTWQGVYLWEHRAQPHQRKLTVTVIGH